MNEFELIDEIVAVLGDVTDGAVLGPGDDASAIEPPPGELLVSSIDALVEGVHFPVNADAERVGYRALMVSLSDLAAMGASPGQALVALTLTDGDRDWALGVARGMRAAALKARCPILGGNLASGARSITVSVHGFCPEGEMLTRVGAQAGEGIYVTGELGGAAAALALGRLDRKNDPLAECYFCPEARIEAGIALRGVASSAIDISDGLLQDLSHLCGTGNGADNVGADIDSGKIPLMCGASVEHALNGGDDYELLFTAADSQLPDLGIDVRRIGEISSVPGIRLDGSAVAALGFRHFQ